MLDRFVAMPGYKEGNVRVICPECDKKIQRSDNPTGFRSTRGTRWVSILNTRADSRPGPLPESRREHAVGRATQLGKAVSIGGCRMLGEACRMLVFAPDAEQDVRKTSVR